jgi:hypothetical protein
MGEELWEVWEPKPSMGIFFFNATYKLYLTKVTGKVKQALTLREKLSRRNLTPYSNLLAVAFN